MSQISVTTDQKEVLRAVLEWLSAGKKPYLTFGGYAGTGKSTLIAFLRLILQTKKPNWRVAFAAYTGKAAQVLDEKLKAASTRQTKDSVGTLHSLLYSPMMSQSGEVSGWMKKAKLEFDLIIIDEASMVTEEIWRDALSFGVPILAVGDHGQLPPIEGKFNLMAEPELVLTKIHRQAAGSPIIQAATLARINGFVPVRRFGPGVEKFDSANSDAQMQIESFFETFKPGTLFLTGMNRTRIGINRSIRQSQYREGDKPEPGDVVICLKNNWRKGIYNGLVGKISHLEGVPDCDGDCTLLNAQITDFGGKKLYSGPIALEAFNQSDRQKLKYPREAAVFDYGYALTVHKAQGSQAEKVILIEERNRHMSDDDWARWLYTAITRAEKELYIFGNSS